MHINAYICVYMSYTCLLAVVCVYVLLYADTWAPLVATDDIQTSVWATRMFKKKNMCQSSMVMRYSCIYVYIYM